jgi:hypothetical protein
LPRPSPMGLSRSAPAEPPSCRARTSRLLSRV